MQTGEPQTIRLSDYRPPAFIVKHIALTFDLDDNETVVESILNLQKNPDYHSDSNYIRLNGEGLNLLDLKLDDKILNSDEYIIDSEGLTIGNVPNVFTLRSRVQIDPAGNTLLEGLYRTGSAFCTQCEAEGFRHITYFPDRPDVMTRFTVTIRADRDTCPVLLSNGNLVEEGLLESGRHYAVWDDPHPKPSYLFALVAGRLEALRDQFRTAGGREVELFIYTEPDRSARASYAMDALKRSMLWDEQVFGLEYDLDRFNIVAVSDFNMGAMENKGLNVFNSKYILADPDTATDSDYAGIERVVAHEYFHNWTGNRVTCRDWFQLSLKEGLTVFRDQQFSADMRDHAVQRIEDVRTLRARQFPEDSGPTAHPIRPDSYIEINNFYTPTIYEKGAEVVRLLYSELGREGFRRGMDLYVARHDNQAVTCDDFRRAMADANGRDLEDFVGWYSQAGTPHVTAHGQYDRMSDTYTLTLKQTTAPTPGQPNKRPLPIPLAIGLVGPDGTDIPLVGEHGTPLSRPVITLTEAMQSFVFTHVPFAPALSLNRGFSAPIVLKTEISVEERGYLAAKDPDPFNRWEAMQQLATEASLEKIDNPAKKWPSVIIKAFRTNIEDSLVTPAFRAALLTIPSEDYLSEQLPVIDPLAVRRVRESLVRYLADHCSSALWDLYDSHLRNVPYSPNATDAGRRALQNVALTYITLGLGALEPGVAQFHAANNMTDRLASLSLLNQMPGEARDEALLLFAERYDDEALVMDKWFSLQATAPLPNAASHVRQMMTHPRFSLSNPNKVRALIGAFAASNPVGFHAVDGSGYSFMAEQIKILNGLNPQLASRLVGPLGRWRRYDGVRRVLMRGALEDIAATPNLARDLVEVVNKSLAD